jgi:hypothetical protein
MIKQQYNVGDIVWFRRGRNKEYGLITQVYSNVVHISCFRNGELDALFPQTFGTYWGVVGK